MLKERAEKDMFREQMEGWKVKAKIWTTLKDSGEWWIIQEYLKDRPRMET
jgi:hypothetical protein